LAQADYIEMGKPLQGAIYREKSALQVVFYYAEHTCRIIGRCARNLATDANHSFYPLSTVGILILAHALEFSILAGIPICCASADGW